MPDPADPLPCDVLVIGGGPAGSTAATLLAQRGRDVVLLEKETHPRFHIGESLLPLNLGIFDRLGVRAAVEAIGVFKPGAEFVSDTTGRAIMFRFAEAMDARYTHSYQVERARFDTVLFENARDSGVRAEQGIRVTDAVISERGRSSVTAQQDDGVIRRFAPRFVLDASGRDTFLAGRLKLLEADKNNNTAAVFAHFQGVECHTDDRAGCISVHLVEDGWFWMIPLPDEIMSVGFVGTQRAFKERTGTTHDLLFARIDRSPSVRARMAQARICSEVRATGNYSYRASRAWGEGYMMIGDAYGFVDPVFSSGVLLAMRAAEMGADVAHAWLDNPARGRTLARAAERSIGRTMDRFGWLIYRINQPAMRGLFMSPRNFLRMRDGVVSVLAGDTRESWGHRLPFIAFKALYQAASLGLQVRDRLRAPPVN